MNGDDDPQPAVAAEHVAKFLRAADERATAEFVDELRTFHAHVVGHLFVEERVDRIIDALLRIELEDVGHERDDAVAGGEPLGDELRGATMIRFVIAEPAEKRRRFGIEGKAERRHEELIGREDENEREKRRAAPAQRPRPTVRQIQTAEDRDPVAHFEEDRDAGEDEQHLRVVAVSRRVKREQVRVAKLEDEQQDDQVTDREIAPAEEEAAKDAERHREIHLREEQHLQVVGRVVNERVAIDELRRGDIAEAVTHRQVRIHRELPIRKLRHHDRGHHQEAAPEMPVLDPAKIAPAHEEQRDEERRQREAGTFP